MTLLLKFYVDLSLVFFFNMVENSYLSGPLMQYRKLIEQGKLQQDPNQEKVALALEDLLGRLEQYEKDMEEYHVQSCLWVLHALLVSLSPPLMICLMMCILFLTFSGKPSQLGEEPREREAQAIDKGS